MSDVKQIITTLQHIFKTRVITLKTRRNALKIRRIPIFADCSVAHIFKTREMFHLVVKLSRIPAQFDYHRQSKLAFGRIRSKLISQITSSLYRKGLIVGNSPCPWSSHRQVPSNHLRGARVDGYSKGCTPKTKQRRCITCKYAKFSKANGEDRKSFLITSIYMFSTFLPSMLYMHQTFKVIQPKLNILKLRTFGQSSEHFTEQDSWSRFNCHSTFRIDSGHGYFQI